MNLIKVRQRVDELLSDLRTAQKRCHQEREKLIEAEDCLVFTEEAQQKAQQVAKKVQQAVHNKIAIVVNRCLQTVFVDEGYGFKIRFDKKRGKTEAVLILTKNGHEIENPLDYDSGAVCEIAGFALRLACLMLSKPKLRKLIVMDEPFKALSVEYWETTRLMLDKLAEDFGIQIIMVTHNPFLKTGKVIEL